MNDFLLNFYDLLSAAVPASNKFTRLRGNTVIYFSVALDKGEESFVLHNFTLKHKASVSHAVGINLGFPASLGPYQQRQTPGVGRGRLPYLEVNIALTTPIAKEIPPGGGGGQ